MNMTLFGSEPEVNPTMLILARESRSFTQKELAEKTKISQANISKYENGLYSVSQEHLETLARVLKYDVSFFLLQERIYGFHSGCLYHRRRQTMPIQEVKKWQARANIIRLQTQKLLRSVDIQPANEFPRLDIESEGKTPEELARQVRQFWNIPHGPIINIIRVIEDAGGIVFRLPFGTRKMDAMVHTGAGAPPIFLTNSESPIDRFRFSIAHEIGHLVMHSVPGEDTEKEADRFASEFLLPSRDIRPYLRDLSFQKLVELKMYWRVSMASLIKKASDLEVINETRYKSLMSQMSAKGYRTKEPIDLSPENPTLIDEIINAHFQIGYSVSDLSKLLFINETEFNTIYNTRFRGMTLIKGKAKTVEDETDFPTPTFRVI